MTKNLIPYKVTQTTEILYQPPRRTGRGRKRQKKNSFWRKIVQAMKWGAGLLLTVILTDVFKIVDWQEIIRDFVSR